MKISEVIDILKEVLEEHGDCQVDIKNAGEENLNVVIGIDDILYDSYLKKAILTL